MKPSRILQIANKQQFRSAQRLRSAIDKELSKIQNAGEEIDMAMGCFDKVEELMKKCAHAISPAEVPLLTIPGTGSIPSRSSGSISVQLLPKTGRSKAAFGRHTSTLPKPTAR